MKKIGLFISLVFLISSNEVIGQSVSKSRHNLSASGNGVIKTLDDSRICIFCHTTHTALPQSPMWNRELPGAIYTLYDSSTQDAKPGQPDGTSILCLSCHDGTIALGNSLKKADGISFSNKMTKRGNIGTDLSDDHPISFVYDENLAKQDRSLKNPSTLANNVLDMNNKLQCTSCHDSHEDLEGNFLKRSNEYSILCFTCHDQKNWAYSSHKSATNNWSGILPNPWEHMDKPYSTVEKNGCSNCHDTHNASGKERLLKRSSEEDNCLDCHNGNVANTNIMSEFTKPYRHDVFSYTGVHDPKESDGSESEYSGYSSQLKHVECVDCHNPHTTNDQQAEAPFVKGSNRGVSGINRSGIVVSEAINEYEICFKCHADNPMILENTNRYQGSSNTRMDFDPSNISMHPVIDIGNNRNPRGLKAPYSAMSKIYCSSCHASNGQKSPAGPHGSMYPRILKANYNLEKTPQLGRNWPVLIQSNFTLCFECHNISAVTDIHSDISGGHFMETIGCNACHDPHGYEGGTQTENAYGINFDRDVIQPNPLNGRMIDLDQKKCFMTCHDPAGVVNYTHSADGDGY